MDAVIGNVIAYLAQEIDDLSVTKLYKLLYLIDEHNVRTHGMPVTWLDYKTWRMGPVPVELDNEIRKGEHITKGDKRYDLLDYVDLKQTNFGPHPAKVFGPKEGLRADLDQLSANELKSVQFIVNQHRYTSANDLIALLHQPETLWSKAK